MSWILEEPLWIILLGMASVAASGALWIRTGYQPLLYTMITLILMTVAALALERAVETEREQIEATLQHIARAVEQNDLPAVMGYLAASAESARRQAEAELPRYEFERVDIKQNLKIQLAAETPARATATFNVVVVVSDQAGILRERRVARHVRVDFVKEGERWFVTSYRHDDPQTGFQRQDRFHQ